jgi:hypothetical protein
MPTKRLPARPDLQHLKHQARDLFNDRRAGTLDACQRIREFHPRFSRATDAEIRVAPFTLADGYLALAREYGFSSWARLRTVVASAHPSNLSGPHHERIQDPIFRRAVDLLDEGDVDGLLDHLARYPTLIRQRVAFEGENYFRNPTLLEFIAENPVRHDGLPPNIVDVARAILEAGGRSDRHSMESTLELVSSGRVPRECGVQLPLIDLLCGYGVSPNAAMMPALVQGELEAVDALIDRGAAIELVVAAATGRIAEALLALPTADGASRHRALALAAQYGQAEILALLLDAGEDPGRYNPVGFHAHSTPLHQAALAGHREIVRLLIERGAPSDLRDTIYHGTPLEWAEHVGNEEIAAFLRDRERSGGATL